MKRLTVISILCLPFLLSTAGGDVIQSLRRESRGYRYLRPSRRELKIAESLFQHLLRGERNLARVVPLCREVGLELMVVKEEGEEYVVLMEIDAARRGRGFYVFRRSRSKPIMIQTPHAFHDLHTGGIAGRLFSQTGVVAAAWNTVSRSETIVGETEKADLAHVEVSYFQALTTAFAQVYPKGLVLQLHGFSREGRSTVEGALSDIIVSNGTSTPGRRLKTLAACLAEQLSLSLAVYPRDVSELGGTTNAQARVLRALDHHGFLHMELSLEARRRLLRSEQDLQRFWACFEERQR